MSDSSVGFIGLGTMGAPMATHIATAGFPLIVWNRTASRVAPLVKVGARAGKSPAHVASEAEIVITMVSRPQDVEEVVLRPDGILEGLRPGSTLVDMSTVSPETSRRLAGAVTAKQSEFLDAPVVGSRGPAMEGTLVILVGGLPQTLARCRPILACLGRTIIHAGGVGMGSALKLATNLVLAHLVAGFAEGMLLVQRAGIDPQRYLEVLEASTFRSPWYQTKGTGMMRRDFASHFALKHMRKDLQLMGALADELGVPLPVTAAIAQLFANAEASGRGDLDYSAVLEHLEGQSPITK